MTLAIGKSVVALTGEALPERSLVGGKAWSIARMRVLDLPVPPAFTITTEACHEYLDRGQLSDELTADIRAGMEWLGEQTGRQFNGGETPLLVSVRSGAPISMPGMMDTVLNLGITDETEKNLAAESGSPEFARDTHRRFLELFPAIVHKATLGELRADSSTEQWREQISAAIGKPLTIDPHEQLIEAVEAVFSSWNSRRAKRYRKHNGIADNLGTAVTVQAMVFGNLDDVSGTGVIFSRNPLTGEAKPYGEYLHRAQGEDVVSGKFTPQPLTAMRDTVGDAYDGLMRAVEILERENGDVQDIEFTVQRGELFLLQTRSAKRAPEASVRFATDMVKENTIDIETSLSRVSAEQVRSVLTPKLNDETELGEPIASGEPACQGIGIGIVVGSSDDAEKRAESGEAVILARPTTSPEDVHGMIAAQAVITEQGGSTSHAAVVSRALGTPCVVGCGDGTLSSLVGQEVTVDGQSGNIYAGAAPIEFPDEAGHEDLAQLIEWLETRIPIKVEYYAEEQHGDVYNLNDVEHSENLEQLPKLLAGQEIVRGNVIESDAGVAAAIAAGVKTIVARNRLPVMLAAWHSLREAD
ncbi:MAG: pyruvate, phosphate dikinase [Gammaproteobacteria bacterium]